MISSILKILSWWTALLVPCKWHNVAFESSGHSLESKRGWEVSVMAGFNTLHSNTAQRWPRRQAKQLHSPPSCMCVWVCITHTHTQQDCTAKHMDRYPLHSDTAGIDMHTYALSKQRVKACLSHFALKLVWATTHNPHHSLPGSPQTITASINKPATHQLAHYSTVTPETAPPILQYRLCESDRLRRRQEGKMPLRVLHVHLGYSSAPLWSSSNVGW